MKAITRAAVQRSIRVTRLKRQQLSACLGLVWLLLLVQGCGGSGNQQTSSPVPTSALSVSTSGLAVGAVGVAYAGTVSASGGSGAGYQWSVASGALPTGLVLSAGGALSGTPTTVGASNATLRVTDSAGNAASGSVTLVVSASTTSLRENLTGNTSPVHDPSIIRQGSTYYAFSTDGGSQAGNLPIRCSSDKVAWTLCGYVFSAMPSWVAATVPGATNLWAPDVSYFNGSYHLYYAASVFGTQSSAIGMATTPTLDSTDPAYKWTDQGAVLTSATGANYNAIDPSLLVDTDGSVWMTYGSYWNGIYQQQVDPATGRVMTGGTIYHLAQRAASVQGDPVEGASLVHKGSYYYLFVSWDTCCAAAPATDNYKIVVGRGASPHGPFLDQQGIDMAQGGGTVLLQGDGVNWSAPGGQTVYLDATGGDLITFHALNVKQNYLDYLIVEPITWTGDWPVIGGVS